MQLRRVSEMLSSMATQDSAGIYRWTHNGRVAERSTLLRGNDEENLGIDVAAHDVAAIADVQSQCQFDGRVYRMIETGIVASGSLLVPALQAGMNVDLNLHRTVAEDEANRAKLLKDAQRDGNGIWRWKSNNRIPPRDFFDSAARAGFVYDILDHDQQREKDTRSDIARYRDAQARRTEAEQIAQASEAVRKLGNSAMNVLTGERHIDTLRRLGVV